MGLVLLLTAVLTVTIGPISSYRHQDDNLLYLNVVQPVSWHENKPPGPVVRFDVGDNDEDVDHQPSFNVSIADAADASIRNAFAIEGSADTMWTLKALETFDHEHRKEYFIPIVIKDVASPTPRSSVVALHVDIEDVNEHSMAAGILYTTVYNYNNFIAGHDIGHVYVEDGDHSDYFDKEFHWHPNTTASKYFNVAEMGGFISAKSEVPAGIHTLHFLVTDAFRQEQVDATVVIDVRDVSEEDIRNSGSLRLSGLSLKEFITSTVSSDVSRRQLLQRQLADIFDVGQDRVEVFSAFNHIEVETVVGIDVRYYVKGMDATHLNALVSDQRRRLESLLGALIVMAGIDECVDEKKIPCSSGCTNGVEISKVPYHIFTRTTSFVGVKAPVYADCSCPVAHQQQQPPPCALIPDTLGRDTLGRDTLQYDRPGCPFGFQAPRCDVTRHASFSGGNWAWYNPLIPCNPSRLTLNFNAQSIDGILLYSGPRNVPANDANGDASGAVSDYVAIELQQGRPVLYLNLGTETIKLQFGESSKTVLDDQVHQLDVQWNASAVQMRLDHCTEQKSHCWASSQLNGHHNLLNTASAPLQLGGVDVDLNVLRDAFGWKELPTSSGFRGCIRNLTYNGRTFNLVAPMHVPRIGNFTTQDGVTFGVTAVVVCISIIGIVVLAVIGFLIFYYVHKSPSEHYNKLRIHLGTKSAPVAPSFDSEMNVIYAQDVKLMDEQCADELLS